MAVGAHRLVADVVEGVIHPLPPAPRVKMGDRHCGQGVDNPDYAVRVVRATNAARVDGRSVLLLLGDIVN